MSETVNTAYKKVTKKGPIGANKRARRHKMKGPIGIRKGPVGIRLRTHKGGTG